MAGPPCGAPLEYCYGASDHGGRLSINHRSGSSDSFGSLISAVLQHNVPCMDPVLDGLLSAWQIEDQEKLAARFNGKHNASVNDPCAVGEPADAVQTVFKMQPRVYERSRSRTITYNPPPDCQVLHLQSLPPDDDPPLLAGRKAAPDVIPPCMGPLHPPPTSDLAPTFITFSMPASHINTPAAHQPPPDIHPPAYANYNCTDQLQGMQGGAAYPSSRCLESNLQAGSIHDPENSFSFHVPCKEFMIHGWHAGIQGEAAVFSLQNNLPAETYMDQIGHYHENSHPLSKLAGPHIKGSSSDQQNFMPYHGLSGGNICHGSLISCPTSTAGGTSPAYMQSSNSTGAVSDSAVMEISGMYIATSSQSVSVPQSPTPSVNTMDVTPIYDTASTQQKIKDRTRSSSSHADVAFRVKTGILDLCDGFSWRKYGEKIIKKTNHKRSYYKCDRSTRSGCKVLKRTQRCSNDEEYVVFTYLGRHNHHP